MKGITLIVNTLIFSACCNLICAQNIKMINDFSNNAILSLCQDEDGLLWVGTCDGLNTYNGLSTSVYTTSEGQELSGNVIEDIVVTNGNILWVNTNFGLNRIDKNKDNIQYYNQFQGNYRLRANHWGDIFVLTENNELFYNYRGNDDTFRPLPVDAIKKNNVLEYVIDSANKIWFFTAEGHHVYYQIEYINQQYTLSMEEIASLTLPLKYSFHEDDVLLLIDKQNNFYEYDVTSDGVKFIFNLEKEMAKRDKVSDIIKKEDRYFISFTRNGVLELVQEEEGFTATDTGIKTGVFFLYKDSRQDIVWIGSDGNGLYQYFNGPYLYRSTTFENKKMNISAPVRSIFMDDQNTLWLGTKGSGILRIFDYDIDKNEFDYRTENVSVSHTLKDNSVFAFAKSRQNILWIGGEYGLVYYSYSENRIKPVKSELPVRYVHSLQEEGDSILWIVTVGDGILKASIGGSKDNPELIRMKRFTINNGLSASNYFFTHYFDNDHTLWFGNRGFGVFTLNEQEELVPHNLLKPYDSRTVNDVFAIIKEENALWLGTGNGLIKQTPKDETLFNSKNGFPQSSIHSMLLDDKKNLWLSTNKGIIRFDTTHDNFQIYNKRNGLNVIEFCDGASFSSPVGLFFGGVNGFVSIKENTLYSKDKFSPPIIFDRLDIQDSRQDRFVYLNRQPKVTLNHHENYFSISFVTIDYINGNNYLYQYKIGDKDNKWIDNGEQNKISFTKMPPGEYNMYVKYKDRYTNEESRIYSIGLEILPPWYQSRLATIVYFILAFMFIVAVLWIIQLRNRKKRNAILERLTYQHKEELYEEKLRFFTNITHEFSTPLTLISGPCERVSSYEKSDPYINKYIGIIKMNAERLHSLVQEIIEYRRIATGNKVCNVQTYNVSGHLEGIINSFSEWVERSEVVFETDFKENIFWNTDIKSFNKIVTNLISNAFKYTPAGGVIRITLKQQDHHLFLHVHNTGKGIKEADMDLIFNRYTVLDTSEVNDVKGFSIRNGLGMAICKSMVELLNGEIRIESEPGKYAEFIVSLPELSCSEPRNGHKETEAEVSQPVFTDEHIIATDGKTTLNLHQQYVEKSAAGLPNILVIDDNEDILFLIQDVLKDKYNIYQAKDGETGLDILKRETIHLIITDIMMPKIDGIELTRIIKSNKHIMHIPLIILSAKSSVDMKIEGVLSGADVYIAKPFDTNYLKAVVERLMTSRSQLREYYNSSASAFEFSNGQLMGKEDKEFLNNVMLIIEEHLDDADFSPEDLADEMRLGIRALYRKFKSLEQVPPSDFIKNYRINYASKLLVTTNLTVQEIMYKVGFHNRAHFYREFNKRLNQTPKEFRNLNKNNNI